MLQSSTTSPATNLFPSRIGLGLAALGRPGYINLGHATDLNYDYDIAAMRAHAHAVLNAAWDAGVRYFDAARSYGRAEEFLSTWLKARRIAPDTVSIGSKWGYTYTANWTIQAEIHEVKEHSLARFTQQWQETSEQLGDHMRLYQIHSATRESGVLTDTALLEALAKLRAEDGVAIGLSLSGPAQHETLRDALAIEINGVRLFDTVQATWNLLERSVGEALQEAKAEGVQVIIKEVLANGRLTARNQDPAFAAKLEVLSTAAQSLNTTIDALAIAVALQQPWIDVVLSGATTIEQLQSNLTAEDVRVDSEVDRALMTLVETPAVYWSKRGKLTWN